jgi:hypothetical protein
MKGGTNMIYLVFVFGGVFACGHVLGQIKGYEKYERYERESKTWSEV